MSAPQAPWWASTAQRARARAFSARGALFAALTITALTGTGALAMTGQSGPTERTAGSGAVYVAATPRALAFGCMEMLVDVNPTSKIGWVDVDADLPYLAGIPASGWFAPQAPQPGAITATPEQVLRGMWSGERAAWYAPDATAETVNDLRALVADHPEWEMRVWPWPAGRRDQMPAGINVAFASWSATQMCEQPDAQVVEALLDRAGTAPGADGSTPPAVTPSQATTVKPESSR